MRIVSEINYCGGDWGVGGLYAAPPGICPMVTAVHFLLHRLGADGKEQ